MFQDDGKCIPRIEQAAEKFRGGERYRQIAGENTPVTGDCGEEKTGEKKHSDRDKDSQTGFFGLFPQKTDQQHDYKQNEDRTAPGQHNAKQKNQKPWKTPKAKLLSGQYEDNRQKQIERIGVRILEETGLTPGDGKPFLQIGDTAQKEREQHHHTRGIRHPPEQAHTLF